MLDYSYEFIANDIFDFISNHIFSDEDDMFSEMYSNFVKEIQKELSVNDSTLERDMHNKKNFRVWINRFFKKQNIDPLSKDALEFLLKFLSKPYYGTVRKSHDVFIILIFEK